MSLKAVERITAVKDAKGAPLPLHRRPHDDAHRFAAAACCPASRPSFSIDWNYNINDARRINARTGYEYFPADKNYIYEIAQWFPRMAAYYDVYGWQHQTVSGRTANSRSSMATIACP